MRGVALPAPPVDAGLYQPGQLKVSLTGVETAPSGETQAQRLATQIEDEVIAMPNAPVSPHRAAME